ncbi:putative transmembrane reductase [Pseudolycoriella hygida]|uniref:ascorbate ferrireductase (transmembrane) n=1 Tax=Pseudolycoriella hygida TaxID=35572 RepID=A0A9Q0NAJ6_9DIPT|nr:putative transmembrane reductase [Pseudolycoriella hygida]
MVQNKVTEDGIPMTVVSTDKYKTRKYKYLTVTTQFYILKDRGGSERHRNYSNNATEYPNSFSYRYWLSVWYNVTVHAALSAVTCFVTYICFYKGMVLFSWHPTLMLIGFLVLMTEAMLTFNPINLPTRELGYRSRVFVHWVLQVVSTCAITASFVIIILNKIHLGKNHFTSNHGKVGLTTIIMSGVSVGFGILAKFSYQFRHYLPLNMKMIHSVLAICCYILAIAAISLGLLTPWFLENVSYPWIYGLIGVVVYVGQYTILKPFLAIVLTVDIECDDMKSNHREETYLTWKTMLYNATIHSAVVGFTVYITILCFSKGTTLFSYHPSLMLAGFLICTTEAILCFSSENIFTRYCNHKQRMTLHWILQTIGASLIGIAFAVIIASKNSNKKRHFATWHGIFGLVAIVASVLAIFGGVVAKYSFSLRQIIRPVTIKVLHSLFGVVVYSLMIFTVLLGVYSNWFKRNSSMTGLVVSNVIILFIVQYVLVQPIQLIYGRIKNIYLRSNLYSESDPQ